MTWYIGLLARVQYDKMAWEWNWAKQRVAIGLRDRATPSGATTVRSQRTVWYEKGSKPDCLRLHSTPEPFVSYWQHWRWKYKYYSLKPSLWQRYSDWGFTWSFCWHITVADRSYFLWSRIWWQSEVLQKLCYRVHLKTIDSRCPSKPLSYHWFM